MVRPAAATLLLVASVAAADGTGTLRGTVRLAGPAPPPRLVDMRADPACPAAPFVDDAVIVGPDGGLANVFVAVDVLEIHPNWYDLRDESHGRPVEVTLSGCRAQPRVVVDLFEQPLVLKNGDPVLHDLLAPGELQLWLPPGESRRRDDLSVPGLVRLDSDLHPWLHVTVGKAQNPFFALTGADGSFVIEGVPAGSYPLRFYHDRYPTRTVPVVVTAGRTTIADVGFEAAADRGEPSAAGCAPLPDRDVPPPAARPASARSLAASRKLADPIAKGRYPGAEADDDATRRRLAIARLLEALDLEPANLPARLALVELALAAYEENDACAESPAGRHDRILLHRWVAATLAGLAPAVAAGCAPCGALAGRIDEGKLGTLLAGAPDVQAALAGLRAGPRTPVAAATRAVIAALELSVYGADPDRHIDAEAWSRAARHVDATAPIRVKILVGGADPPDDVAHVTLAGRKALARWAARRFSPEIGNGGRLDGRLECTGRCCAVRHEGNNIMRTDLLEVCFDAGLRVTRLLVEEGGP